MNRRRDAQTLAFTANVVGFDAGLLLALFLLFSRSALFFAAAFGVAFCTLNMVALGRKDGA